MPHNSPVTCIKIRPETGEEGDLPMAVTTGLDGYFKIWSVVDDTNIYSKLHHTPPDLMYNVVKILKVLEMTWTFLSFFLFKHFFIPYKTCISVWNGHSYLLSSIIYR